MDHIDPKFELDNHPETILIVEDDAALAYLIRKNLQRAGFHVVIASGGVEAIGHIHNQPPLLMLLDYRLPDMSGRQLIETLLEQDRTVPFVITTGHGDERVAVEMMKLGARDYLVKDADFLELLFSVVERLVRQLTTERRLAETEQQLQKSEQKYRNLFEYANDSIFIIDPSTGRILDANQNAARRLGYSQGELLQLRVEDIDMPQAAVRNDEIFQELLATGYIVFEHLHRRKDGTEMPVEISSRVIDLDGRRVFQSHVRDITERKRAEQKFRTRLRQQAVAAELGQQALTRLELSELMNQAVIRVAETLNVEYCTVLEFLAREDQLLVRAGVGWQSGTVGRVTVPTGTRSQAGYTLANHQPVVVEDLEQEARFGKTSLLSDHGVVSGLSVIIGGSGQALPFGVLAAHTVNRRAFAESDLHFLQAVANVLATAIERNRSEDEIRRANRELTVLNHVITASAAIIEPEMILHTACRELVLFFDVSHATAALLNEEKSGLVTVTDYNVEGTTVRPDEPMPVQDNPLIEHLFKYKSPLVVDDALKDPRFMAMRDWLPQRKIESLLLVPLVTEKEVVGCLELDSSRPHAFSYEYVNVAWSVADQIAGALARAQLSQTQRRLSTVIDQTADSVIITDVEGKIIYVNPAFERITGYSRAEAIGQNPRFLKSGKHAPDFYEEMWSTIGGGHVWRGRFSNRRKDGTIFIEDATISPVRAPNGEITNYVGVKRDVTRELELEQHYYQAQKMEAVGRLTGGIAHDFNNLLTGINGFVELMQFKLPADSPLQEMVGTIHRSGQRAADLVRQLMAFSRKQDIEPRVFDLNAVVSDLSKLLARLIGEDITLECSLAPNLWPLKADLSQIEQVVVNLVLNARDAMPNGGQITIRTSNQTLSETDVMLDPGTRPGDYVLLEISDTGIGMSEEVKLRIFEPFFTTKNKGRGTGLGLATSYGIIKQHGGCIWVDSEEGEGTTFKIYWPRSGTEIKDSPEKIQLQDLPGGTETILVVEDESGVRAIITAILKKQGYKVLEAGNGEEALALGRANCGELQLLLTDVVMPQMGGKRLADQLLVDCPGIKVLYISGYTDEAIAQYGVLKPDVSLIQKPFTSMSLAFKVREVLDS